MDNIRPSPVFRHKLLHLGKGMVQNTEMHPRTTSRPVVRPLDTAAFQEFAVVALLVDGGTPRHVVRAAIHRYPKAAAGDVMFELICVANDLHDRHRARTTDTRALANALFRACAMLAADIHAIAHDRPHGVTCADVAAFWGDQDAYFTPPPA
ncbi:hypothetical protein [Oceaniglobus indicus]|uniref:hypothetical protein n=1 Tax=Oceaniglobus indicus TaxID=2047749 RepID=UPI000C196009|nr:hypothetical protein [Oceaniglobus indicus]